jgi:glycerophosphoryl diester phosphodiesterase
MSRPTVIAHRGVHQNARENTLRAFELSLVEGIAAIELDVHRSVDGVVVVHHDAGLRRADGSMLQISRSSRAELGRAREGTDAIPSLDDVLDLVRSRAHVHIEMKQPRIGESIVEVLARHPGADASVHSFHYPSILELKRLAPGLRTGVGVAAYHVDAASPLREASASDYWAQWDLIDAVMVESIHRAGGRVIAWTVNRPEDAADLAAMRVDGICTDAADLVIARLARTES